MAFFLTIHLEIVKALLRAAQAIAWLGLFSVPGQRRPDPLGLIGAAKKHTTARDCRHLVKPIAANST